MRRALLLLCLVLFACDKEKPKPDDTKKAEATPVPSGLVFNDFLPTNGGSGAGLGVRDAGGEGGLAAVGGSAGGGEPGESAGEPGAGEEIKVKLTEAGSEPRAVRKYTFVANKVEKRILTLTQSVTQSMAGQTAPPQEITIKIALDLTAKQVKPAGATMEAKVTKVELPGAPPQAQQMLASLNGLGASFEITSRGEVGELSFGSSPAMKNQLAQSVLQAVSQISQLLVAPVPAVAIGAGAKWEATSAGSPEQPEQRTNRFTLKEVNAEGGVIEIELDSKVPRRQGQDPRSGAPLTVEGDSKGKFTQQVRWATTSPKTEGELMGHQKIETQDQRGKQSIVITQKSKQLIESAK